MRKVMIRRVCFNFGSKCNMHCPCCYIPFSGSAVEEDICRRVISRCGELGAKVITVGGGDPLLYPFICGLLEYAGAVGVEVHVDTNGIMLSPKHITTIAARVSLLGLPLDGFNSDEHGAMRESLKHFDVVLDRFRTLRDAGIRIKINTIVSAINYTSLDNMSELINELRPELWDLYQFWPIAGGAKVRDRHILSDDAFDKVTAGLGLKCQGCRVVPHKISDRKGHYFFVSHDGQVYTHRQDAAGDYVFIGSIFDDMTIERWGLLGQDSMRPKIEARYHSK